MHTSGSQSTRIELLGRVTNWQDHPAWETFSHLYRPLIHGFSLRSGLTNEEAQEVAQDTLLEVARRLQDGEYHRDQGSFRGWLFQLTRWRVANQLRKRRPGLVSLDQPGVIDAVEAATAEAQQEDKSWEEEWRRALLHAALERLSWSMNHQHHQVLHALVWLGLPPGKVAQNFGLSRTAVYIIKLRGLIRLKQQIAILQNSPPPEATPHPEARG